MIIAGLSDQDKDDEKLVDIGREITTWNTNIRLNFGRGPEIDRMTEHPAQRRASLSDSCSHILSNIN
jgi:hypothetical protein